MKVLIVANHNTGNFTPFVVEQVDALRHLGIDVDFYGIHGKGIFGYLSNRSALMSKIREYHPDLIHAHYGLSGLLANLQRIVPVVTTYHGSDIHSKGLNLFLSRFSIRLSAFNIFVSPDLFSIAGIGGGGHCVLPCGIDAETFVPIERSVARKKFAWDLDKKYILFAGAFANPVKNSPLAKEATALIPDAELVELKGFNREQVNLAMNAANCLLLTSHREGSPQVIKEAMACGTPIVSVDVGDVKELTTGIEGCYITSYDINDIVRNLNHALSFDGKILSRERLFQRMLTNNQIAKKIHTIYQEILS